MHTWRRLWLGGLVGLILTVPLLCILYAGYRRAGLPFIPFNLFDWGTRILPGAVITAGIDTMVRVIHALHLGGTSATAKLAEQSMAIAGFLVTGIILGALFFLLARGRFTIDAGLIVGGLLGLAALLVNRSVSPAGETLPVWRVPWLISLFLAWGAALGWAYRRLIDHDAELPANLGGRSEVERAGRRRFLMRLGGAAAAISFVGALLGRRVSRPGSASRIREGAWSATNPLPNAGAAVKPAPGTRPELTPVSQHYRIDINTVPPTIQQDSWRLKISGLVDKPVEFTLDDLRHREPMEQFITLSCISNTVGGDLIGTTRWTGTSLKHFLPELGLQQDATHLKIRSADGFYEVVALDQVRSDERVMLAYAWDGLPLTTEHGFPLRIYIPDRYGMKQPKWIESIEATDHWEPGYWVTRGWDREAQMKATSVIDTVASNMMVGEPNPQMRVPIGGIAHAGVRGISKVEVRVDGGPWQPAELRTPLSGQTWVIWRYDWPLQRGKHTFAVRCFDGNGAAQIEQDAPPHPSGASGINTRTAMF